MFCSECGNLVHDGVKFCAACGHSVAQTTTAATAAAPSVHSISIDNAVITDPAVAKSAASSKRRITLLVSGVVLLGVGVVIAVLVTMSSPSGIFPTGAGSGLVSWSGGSGRPGGSPVDVSGHIQGEPLTAILQPSSRYSFYSRFSNRYRKHVAATASGTFGSNSFSVSLTNGLSLSGTFGGQPVSGSLIRTSPNDSRPVFKVQGIIDGQPVSGTLRIGQPNDSRSLTFTGTVGNLSITGTANWTGTAVTTYQQIRQLHDPLVPTEHIDHRRTDAHR